MELRDVIKAKAEGLLENPAHFVVDVVLSVKPGSKRILVLVDGDAGISIDDCATLSRNLSEALDADSTWEDAYTLEVSTPGVDQPLKLMRQYTKNIGRAVKITLRDKTVVAGTLTAVHAEAVVVSRTPGHDKKKTREEESTPLSLDQIDKTIVQISFK